MEGEGFDAPFVDFDKHAGIPPGANWEQTLYREIDQWKDDHAFVEDQTDRVLKKYTA